MSVDVGATATLGRKRALGDCESAVNAGQHHASCKRKRRGLFQLQRGDWDAEGAVVSLHERFPKFSRQVIERVLVVCEENVDKAGEYLQLRQLLEDARETTGHHATTSSHSSHPDQGANEDDPTQSLEAWADYVVHTMSRAGSIAEAKQLALASLKAFAKRPMPCSQASQLEKENAILKKAVTIQNSRLSGERQESMKAIHALRQLVSGYESQVRNLELGNYTLKLHLREASGGAEPFGSRGPNRDIF